MQTHQNPLVLRYKGIERLENVIYDNSGIATYKKCPRLYLFEAVFHLRSKIEPLYLHFGSAYHKFREVLELEYNKIEGNKNSSDARQACYNVASLAGMKLFTELTKDRDFTLEKKYGFLNLSRLLQSFMAAFEWWNKEKNIGNITVLTVEQFATVLFSEDDGSGNPVFLSIRQDQFVEWNGRKWIRDYKTSKEDPDFYDRRITPSSQFTQYTWGATELTKESVAGVMVELLFNANVPPSTKVPKTEQAKKFGPAIHSFMATRSEYDIETWKRDTLFTVQNIKKSRELDVYPMNEQYHCGFCPHHSTCKLSENAQVAHLEAHFKQRIWDPSANTGDE